MRRWFLLFVSFYILSAKAILQFTFEVEPSCPETPCENAVIVRIDKG